MNAQTSTLNASNATKAYKMEKQTEYSARKKLNEAATATAMTTTTAIAIAASTRAATPPQYKQKQMQQQQKLPASKAETAAAATTVAATKNSMQAIRSKNDNDDYNSDIDFHNNNNKNNNTVMKNKSTKLIKQMNDERISSNIGKLYVRVCGGGGDAAAAVKADDISKSNNNKQVDAAHHKRRSSNSNVKRNSSVNVRKASESDTSDKSSNRSKNSSSLDSVKKLQQNIYLLQQKQQQKQQQQQQAMEKHTYCTKVQQKQKEMQKKVVIVASTPTACNQTQMSNLLTKGPKRVVVTTVGNYGANSKPDISNSVAVKENLRRRSYDTASLPDAIKPTLHRKRKDKFSEPPPPPVASPHSSSMESLPRKLSSNIFHSLPPPTPSRRHVPFAYAFDTLKTNRQTQSDSFIMAVSPKKCLHDDPDLQFPKSKECIQFTQAACAPTPLRLPLGTGISPYPAISPRQSKLHQEQLKNNQKEEAKLKEYQSQRLLCDISRLTRTYGSDTVNNALKEAQKLKTGMSQVNINASATKANKPMASKHTPLDLAIDDMLKDRNTFRKVCKNNRFYNNPEYLEPWTVFNKMSNKLADVTIQEMHNNFAKGITDFVKDFLVMEGQSSLNIL